MVLVVFDTVQKFANLQVINFTHIAGSNKKEIILKFHAADISSDPASCFVVFGLSCNSIQCEQKQNRSVFFEYLNNS